MFSQAAQTAFREVIRPAMQVNDRSIMPLCRIEGSQKKKDCGE